MFKRKMSHEIAVHDCVRVNIEQPTGYQGRQWLTITFVGPQGEETEIAVWGLDDKAPELVLEDNVSVRRVKTIGEGSDA